MSLIERIEKWREPPPLTTGEVEVRAPMPGCVLLIYPNTFEMNWQCFRIQEFYESPKFANWVFHEDEYMRWYASKEHKRKKSSPNCTGFDYLSRVIGLNFPGERFVDFYERYQGVTRKLEDDLWWTVNNALVRQNLTIASKFYVIASFRSGNKADDALNHELLHARYYLDAEYRAKVEEIVRTNWSLALQRALLKQGYNDEVLVDEAHAFSLDGYSPWFPWWKRDKQSRAMRKALRKQFPSLAGKR